MDIPTKIRFEACNMCQLKCRSCETPGRKKDPGIVGWGYLKFKDFRELLEKNPSIKEVNLSWLGEIFLNPDFGKIIRYSFKKGIILRADGGVNLNNVSRDILNDLVRCKFASMTVAIDGASQETYVKYRKRGDFKKVISNIMAINRYKKQYLSGLPALSWQFIVFGHNEHEISIARKLAKKLWMRFFTKMSWDQSYSSIRNKEFVRAETGADVITRGEYTVQYGKDYMDGVCRQLWEEPVINWDGNLFGCCKNNRMSFGNVFDSGLGTILSSEKYLYMKDMIAGRKPPSKSIICTKCPVYKNRKK